MWDEYWLEMAKTHHANGREICCWLVLFLNYKED